MRPSGIVDQHIEAAVMFDYLRKKRIGVFLSGEIRRNAQGGKAGGVHFLLGMCDGVRFKTAKGDFRPCTTKRLRKDPSESARTAGYQYDFVFPIAHGDRITEKTGNKKWGKE